MKLGHFYFAGTVLSEYVFDISAHCLNSGGVFWTSWPGQNRGLGKERQEWIFSLEVSVALELAKERAFLISEPFGGRKDPICHPRRIPVDSD